MYLLFFLWQLTLTTQTKAWWLATWLAIWGEIQWGNKSFSLWIKHTITIQKKNLMDLTATTCSWKCNNTTIFFCPLHVFLPNLILSNSYPPVSSPWSYNTYQPWSPMNQPPSTYVTFSDADNQLVLLWLIRNKGQRRESTNSLTLLDSLPQNCQDSLLQSLDDGATIFLLHHLGALHYNILYISTDFKYQSALP